MKLNKLFLGLFGVAALTLASCSDDDKYEWATASGPQVFFSDQLESQFEIDPEGTSFNVPISRADASGSLTVNLTSSTANPMYSIPASVTFNAGEKEANIPVSYDPAKIEYGRYDSLTIKIADDAQATSWGTQEFTFTAGVTDWGPWQEWNSAGTAVYTYVVYWEGDDQKSFTYRHNMIKPNLYQFKMTHWGSDVDIIWDYDEETGIVSVAPQFAAVNSTNGNVTVSDYCYYQTVVKGTPTASPTGYFDKEQGILACPVVYYVSAGSFGADYEYMYIDGYVRADYSLDITYGGIFTDVANVPYAVAQVTAGSDVAEISSVIVEADADPDAVADAIVAGDIEASVTAASSQIYVPMPEGLTGKLQIVSAVIVDGELKSVAAAPLEYFGGGSNPWQSLGTGYLSDNLLITMFYSNAETKTTFEPQTYEVEILENKDEPGIYRIVNAFAKAADLLGYSSDYKPTNIEVNATVADGVYILPQTVGFEDFAISTVGGYYLSNYDFDTLYKNNYFGKLENGVMSFPVFENKDKETGEVKSTFQGFFHSGGKNYYAGSTGEFKITFPSAADAARTTARRAAKATTFARHLNGYAQFDKNAKKANKIIKGIALKKDVILK